LLVAHHPCRLEGAHGKWHSKRGAIVDGHGPQARELRGVLALLRLPASEPHLPQPAPRGDVPGHPLRRGGSAAAVLGLAAGQPGRRLRVRLGGPFLLREEQARDLHLSPLVLAGRLPHVPADAPRTHGPGDREGGPPLPRRSTLTATPLTATGSWRQRPRP